jgi:hypothetical protein
MMDQKIAVVCDKKIGLYSLQSLFKSPDFRDRVILYLPKELEGFAKKSFPHIIIKTFSWKRKVFRLFLYKVLKVLLTPNQFSLSGEKAGILGEVSPHSRLKKFFFKVLLRFPGIKKPKVNSTLRMIFQHLISNEFSTSKIMVCTHVNQEIAMHLCAKNLTVSAFVESWDHSVKQPVGYVADQIFVWNKDLGRDWIEHQGETEVVVTYPFKLRYAEVGSPQHGVKVLYPATFSSQSIPSHYVEEKNLMRELAKVCESQNVTLLIKPKPNGKAGEYDDISKEFSGVQISEYGSGDGRSGYFFTEQDNLKRCQVLESCQMVINLGTTFALDAALYGLPILQLDLRRLPDFPHLSRCQNNLHLRKYILSHENFLFPLLKKEEFSGLLNEEAVKRAGEFSSRLKNWIRVQSLEEGVRSILRRL